MHLRSKPIQIAAIVYSLVTICNGKNYLFPKWRPNYLYFYRHLLPVQTNSNTNFRQANTIKFCSKAWRVSTKTFLPTLTTLSLILGAATMVVGTIIASIFRFENMAS